MADVFTPEKRSEVMSRIRGGNTRPELALRSMLHRSGYRFTVTGPRNRKLPGRPDLVLPKYRTVIFVHGCFWHGHPHCPDFRLPATRREWWRAKIDGNRARAAGEWLLKRLPALLLEKGTIKLPVLLNVRVLACPSLRDPAPLREPASEY